MQGAITAVTIVIIGAILWVWRAGMRPAPNKIESPDHLASVIQFLVRRGIRGGSVRLQVDDDPSRAVTFTKYIVKRGDVGLVGRCTRGGEPELRFAAIQRDLTERGVPYKCIVQDGQPTLEIDCGRDLGLAVMFTLLVFQDLFDRNISEHCVAYFHDVLISDVPSLTGVDDVTE